MGLHKRAELEAVLSRIEQGERRQAYLFFGERYLCRQALQQLEERLLSSGGGSVHSLDGTAEDPARLLSRLRSHSLLPGLQIYRVTDTTLFHSREVGEQIWNKACKAMEGDKLRAASRYLAELLQLGAIPPGGTSMFSDISPAHWPKLFGFAHPGTDLAWADKLASEITILKPAGLDPLEKLMAAIKTGLPGSNILVLTAEDVDKRKKLFTHIKKHGEVIDCSVAEGSSRAAVSQQKAVITEMVRTTLAALDTTIDPAALEMFLERVGFHPVGAVLEAEKLALFIDAGQTITSRDVDTLVGRTREDAIFQLTEALARGNAGKTLIILDHLLSDGVHLLAVIASLRNYLRRLLIFKSLQLRLQPVWSPRLSANDFQKDYLPALKETGLWPDLLRGHPYGLFVGFNNASKFSIGNLKRSLGLLLEAEFKLKGSPVPGRLVVEELLLSLLRLNQPGERRKHDHQPQRLKTA
jgi:DNA polymerase-3 subunit delta